MQQIMDECAEIEKRRNEVRESPMVKKNLSKTASLPALRKVTSDISKTMTKTHTAAHDEHTVVVDFIHPRQNRAYELRMKKNQDLVKRLMEKSFNDYNENKAWNDSIRFDQIKLANEDMAPVLLADRISPYASIKKLEPLEKKSQIDTSIKVLAQGRSVV